MKILNYRPFSEMLSDLKNITLLNNEDIRPYKNADIRLLEFRAENLNPTSLYYLKSSLEIQEKLREELLELGYDTLKLGGILTIEGDDGKEYSIMPPIVEVVEREVKFIPRAGEINYDKEFSVKYAVLLDGIHRALLAKKLGLQVQVLYVENVDKTCPAYAFPNTWDEVVGVYEVPSITSEKKYYIAEKPKEYYKDYSSLILSFFRE